jgi:hypothetical protein
MEAYTYTEIYIFIYTHMDMDVYRYTKDLCVGWRLPSLLNLAGPGRPYCIFRQDSFRSQMRSGAEVTKGADP